MVLLFSLQLFLLVSVQVSVCSIRHCKYNHAEPHITTHLRVFNVKVVVIFILFTIAPDVCIPLVLCEAMSVDLVRYPNTPAPASGSKTLATQCADNARRVSSSLNVECSSDGSWSGDPECQCNSGYKIDTLNGKVICKSEYNIHWTFYI